MLLAVPVKDWVGSLWDDAVDEIVYGTKLHQFALAN